MQPRPELTPSRANLARRLLAANLKRDIALRCGFCGQEVLRCGEWVRQNPVFMCGRCFQDTHIDLAVLERGTGLGRASKIRREPQRLAPHQPPIRRTALRFILSGYGGSGR
jgi:hypothetical protein